MDLRIQKTRKAIVDAFIELRAKKPLNKITVTELSKIAMISKATFYLHYKDIYDLSEQLQEELITDVIDDIRHPEEMLLHPGECARSMLNAFYSKIELTNILFPKDESEVFVRRIEAHLKSTVYRYFPEHKDNMELDIALTMLIYGTFSIYRQHDKTDSKKALECIDRISNTLIKSIL